MVMHVGIGIGRVMKLGFWSVMGGRVLCWVKWKVESRRRWKKKKEEEEGVYGL